jgi:hypothetical protein
MKFRSSKSKQPPVRQRIRSDDSPPPAPYNYYARRDQRPEAGERTRIQNEPVRKRLKVRSFVGLPTRIAIAGGVIVGLGLLWLPGPARVEFLSVKDAPVFSVRDRNAYQQGADDIVARSLGNRFKPTLDTKAVESQMLREFPELATVRVTSPFIGTRPTVYVEIAQPVLLLAASNGTYVIDDRGKALALQDNVTEEQTAELPVVTDQSNIRVSLNKQVLTPDNILFIRTILAQLDAKGVAYANLTLPANANELDVRPEGQPYFVKFNLASNTPRAQVGTMLATMQDLKKKNITPSSYIDVRVEGRAYYL